MGLILKTVWIQISWLLQKPADLGPRCFEPYTKKWNIAGELDCKRNDVDAHWLSNFSSSTSAGHWIKTVLVKDVTSKKKMDTIMEWYYIGQLYYEGFTDLREL